MFLAEAVAIRERGRDQHVAADLPWTGRQKRSQVRWQRLWPRIAERVRTQKDSVEAEVAEGE